MWNYVMLSVLVKQYTCQLFHALFFPHYLLHLSLIQCMYIQLCFLFISHLNWSGWWQYLAEEKHGLGGDSTPVVHAREPALPHITQTLTDCTPAAMDREPASPSLTPIPADSNPVLVDTTPSPPQSTQTRAVSKATTVPKARGPPLRTPSQRLKQKKNCSQVRFRSYGSYYFALASLYLLIPTNFKFEGCNWNSNGATGMF